MSRPATSASRWTLWDWPFLEPEHHELARRTVAWNAASHALHDNVDFPERCRAIVKSLGDAGLPDQVVPPGGGEIGRASGRGRVCQSGSIKVGAVSAKQQISP